MYLALLLVATLHASPPSDSAFREEISACFVVIYIFIICARLEDPTVPLIDIIRTTYRWNMIHTVDEKQGLGLISTVRG